MTGNLVVDRRSQVPGAGTHVLLCAVDQYPHLVPGDTARWGARGNLSCAVATARAILEWLQSAYYNPAAPLATCRVLLSPVGDDQSSIRATGENLLRAAAEWRRDAASSRDAVTMFYFAGHGFSMGPTETVMLMEDFGDGVGSDLRNALDVASLLNGMAPSQQHPDMARTQLYFIDAGRRRLAGPESIGARPTPVFDAALPLQDDRAALVFQASSDNEDPFGRVGGLSLFGESLLRCLGGKGAVQRDERWVVTTLSLMEEMRDDVAELARAAGVEQSLSIQGLTKEAVVAVLPDVPTARFRISGLGPSDSLKISDSNFQEVLSIKAPSGGWIEEELKAGLYVLEVEGANRGKLQRMVALVPGRTSETDVL